MLIFYKSVFVKCDTHLIDSGETNKVMCLNTSIKKKKPQTVKYPNLIILRDSCPHCLNYNNMYIDKFFNLIV